ncbi:DUF2158 domain-containing protein [Epilithonimonas sp.]|uniref:DUF2158 domain-containing protein n=1 Tax=Epilithonimonas sp. TaxID=2894511 RepID=UPI00289D4B38|nr:DUF2158 domain-containing protein [Epilithonimonas sp.]
MSKDKFKKGDIVVLKEGGPRMKVEKVVKNLKAYVADETIDPIVTSIETSHFIDDKPVHGLYAASLLKKLEN